MAARLSFTTSSKPNCVKVGQFTCSNFGDFIFAGVAKTVLTVLSFSTFFLKLVNTSGISLSKKGKSCAWYNVLVLKASNAHDCFHKACSTASCTCNSSYATSFLATTFCALNSRASLGISSCGLPCTTINPEPNARKFACKVCNACNKNWVLMLPIFLKPNAVFLN